MTLGPALCVLAWMDRPLGPWAARVAIYGRVPLFYYVLHLFLIHALAIALAWPALGAAAVAHPFVRRRALALPAARRLRALGRPSCSRSIRRAAGSPDVKRRSRAAWVSYL